MHASTHTPTLTHTTTPPAQVLIATDVLSRGFDVSQARPPRPPMRLPAAGIAVAPNLPCVHACPPVGLPPAPTPHKLSHATPASGRHTLRHQVTLVVNYDIPVERDGLMPAYDTYLHRIGRSGRFGRKGAAFNLICGDKARRGPRGGAWAVENRGGVCLTRCLFGAGAVRLRGEGAPRAVMTRNLRIDS